MRAINALGGLVSTYRPATYVTWTAENLEDTPSLASDRTLTLIGEAEGGAPLVPYVITNPTQARGILRGGTLLDAALLAFTSAGAGGLTVIAVNVLGGTQSSIAITGADGGTFGTLTSQSYRERANQIRAQVYGAPETGYTAVIEDGDSGFLISGAGIGKALNLQYIGKGSTATASVREDAGALVFVVEVADQPTDGVRIALDTNITVADLVRKLQATGAYVASVGRDGNLSSSKLDKVDNVDIKTASKMFGAIRGDFEHFFETAGNKEVNFKAEEGGSVTPATSFTGFFTGGKTVATKPESWAKAMQAIQKTSTAIIVPLTPDPVLVAGLRSELAHRNSAAEGRFSMMVAGYDDAALPKSNTAADVNTYISRVAADLAVINNQQFQMVCNTGEGILPATGKRGLLPMYIVAAIFAAEVLGKGAENSATYSYISLGKPYPELDLSQSSTMVQRGALIFEQPTTGGGVRVVRDRTTYTSSNNPIYESGMSVRVMNSVARGFKVLMDQFIPGSASAHRLADFQSAANDYFENYVERGFLTSGGTDANGQAVPAYSFKLQRTQSGGRQVISSSRVVPKSEFVVGEHTMVARSVEFQVSSGQ